MIGRERVEFCFWKALGNPIFNTFQLLLKILFAKY